MPSEPNSSNLGSCDNFLELQIFFSWSLGCISCLLGYFTTKWWCEAAESRRREIRDEGVVFAEFTDQ
tara:strand:+ start:1346 stop:1546 length:201 start_codon:yes stop_codon:yes gene_type:complete